MGTQYRTAIFAADEAQAQAAQAAKERLEREGGFRRPVATRIEPAPTFWKAEDYHQQYFEKRGLRSFGH
jgi:peptide-methionine (S)-S-oxide reductase